MSLWNEPPQEFNLAPTIVQIGVFRANNAKEACKAANVFMRAIDQAPFEILDFWLTGGGGGNVDLSVVFDLSNASLHPSTADAQFYGVEAADALAFDVECNRVLDGTLAVPFGAGVSTEVGGISVATGAAAGKICAALLLLVDQA
jgi:hypothetical protein